MSQEYPCSKNILSLLNDFVFLDLKMVEGHQMDSLEIGCLSAQEARCGWESQASRGFVRRHLRQRQTPQSSPHAFTAGIVVEIAAPMIFPFSP